MKPESLALLIVAVFAVGAIVIFVSLRRKGRRAAEERQRRIRHYESAPIVRRPQPKAAPAPSATGNAPTSATTSSATDDNGVVPVILVHTVLASGDNHQPVPACAVAYEAPASSPTADTGGVCGAGTE